MSSAKTCNARNLYPPTVMRDGRVSAPALTLRCTLPRGHEPEHAGLHYDKRHPECAWWQADDAEPT